MKNYIAMLVALLLSQGICHAETWKIRADAWCPYNCAPGASQGYMLDVIALAAKASENTLDYKVTPWPRALNAVRHGVITGVVGVSRAESTGLLLTDKMGEDTTCAYVTQESTFKFTSVEDLGQLRKVGTTLGVIYSPEFTQWQKHHADQVLEAVGEDTLLVNVERLKNNSIQAFIENSAVVAYARKSNPNLRYVVSAGCIATEDLFVGIDAKNPRAEIIVNTINTTLAGLRKGGELKRIMSRYGMQPW